MEKLIVLGTGNAMVTKCYNTCFALALQEENILVDAGGGNGILVQLEKADVPMQSIHHLIVTHEHCDHLLGVLWVLRKAGTLMLQGKYEGELHLWAHAALLQSIQAMAGMCLQKKFTNLFGSRFILHTVQDGTQGVLAGVLFTFFDIHSTKATQYGFTAQLPSGQKLTFLGDEPYNPLCEAYVRASSWLLCEAFCLYEQRERFKPYEKHHSTVKEACELARQMQIPHLVLWHTEDKNYAQRKALYTAEGEQYYNGHLYVPYDLETIGLQQSHFSSRQ